MEKSYTISTISNCQGGGGVDHYLQSMIVKKLSKRSFVAGCAGLRADAAPISENIYASLRYSCHPCPWRVPCFKGPRHTIDKSSFSVADDFCILIFSLIKFVVVIVVVVVVVWLVCCCCCCHCRCCCCWGLKFWKQVNVNAKDRFTRYNFVSYDMLATSLRHESFRVNQAYNLLAIVAYDTKNVVAFEICFKTLRQS